MQTSTLERGSPVIVRTYGGRAEVRFVWEERAAGFIVTERPGDGEAAVGIPAADVFRYDETVAQEIAHGMVPDWKRLRGARQ